MANKLLKEVYKTREGASRRARFENGLAPFEFSRGYKAKLYHYVIALQVDGTWRVMRTYPAR